jgi:PAS domain S-box-containing protein
MAAVWSLLAVSCGYMICSADALRGRIARNARYLRAAETVHDQLDALGRRLDSSSPTFDLTEDLRLALERSSIIDSLPVRGEGVDEAVAAWRDAAPQLLEAAVRDDASLPARVEIARPRQKRLAAAVGALLHRVRHDSSLASESLGHHWAIAYALSVGVLVALAASMMLYLRGLRQKRLLEDSRAALTENERRFRNLVHRAHDLIWAIDAEGRWTFVNNAAARVYGYQPGEMLGRKFRDFVAPEHLDREAEIFQSFVAGRPEREYEQVHLQKNGTPVRLRFSASLIRDADGKFAGVSGTASDFTAMHEMQERLMQTERLQALGTLASGVAHDFNNLLTVIVGHSEFAKRVPDLPEPLLRRVNAILETSSRAQRLTHQLLAFSRRAPSVQSELIDLCSVIRHMDDLLTRLIGKQLKLNLEFPPGSVRVRGDWSQIEQAVVNLVVNARDAMPNGGEITISVGRMALDEVHAANLGVAAGEWARLEVRDRGCGMDSETLRRAFEPFFTTKGPGKGTGLGLPNVMNVVSHHGGKIDVESELGKGTTVTILLPICSDAHLKAAPAHVAPQARAEEARGE